jgi:hypothetical protein
VRRRFQTFSTDHWRIKKNIANNAHGDNDDNDNDNDNEFDQVLRRRRTILEHPIVTTHDFDHIRRGEGTFRRRRDGGR